MTEFDTPAARALVKDALTAVLQENREWLSELIQEALVDVAHAEERREADLRTHEMRPFPRPHGRA